MALKPWISLGSSKNDSADVDNDGFVFGSDDEDAVMIEAPPVTAPSAPEPEPESEPRAVAEEEACIPAATAVAEAVPAVVAPPPPTAPPAATITETSVQADEPEEVEKEYAEDDGSVAETNISVPAAVAGSVTGLIIGGPVLAVAGGVGAAYASTTEGPAGDIARASGDVAVSVGHKAKEVDEKHKFVERTRETVQEAWTKVREFDEKHGTIAGIRAFFLRTRARAVEFERENRVVEHALIKIAEGAQNLAEWVRQQSEGEDGWTDASAEMADDVEKMKH